MKCLKVTEPNSILRKTSTVRRHCNNAHLFSLRILDGLCSLGYHAIEDAAGRDPAILQAMPKIRIQLRLSVFFHECDIH